MFYNESRITKAALMKINNKSLSIEDKNLKERYQKLINLQKKEKIDDCFLVKYMKKCGIKTPNNVLDEEIKTFMKTKKLRKIDLNKIKLKIDNALKNQNKTEFTKVIKSSPNIFLNNNNKKILTELKPGSSKDLIPKKNILSPLHLNNSNNIKDNQTNLSLDNLNPNKNLNQCKEEEKNDNKISPENNIKTANSIQIKKKIYLNPEDELADLEKELGLEQASEIRKKKFEKFYKYFSEGNEWDAIYKYNNEMYKKQLEEEKRKKFENKILLRIELDKQIKEKAMREKKAYLENEKYKELFNENNKKMIKLEEERDEEKTKKLNLEKKAQEQQIKTKNIMKRLELLREKKFEKDVINNLKTELDKEKKLYEEKKLKNFLEMKKMMEENENKIRKKEEDKIKEKEKQKIYSQDLEKTEIKKENERKKILNKIKSVGDYQSNEKIQKILEKMQQDLDEEDQKLNNFIKNRKKLEDMKMEEEKKKKLEIRKELRFYLDNQIQEKKREKEFEKMLYREQGRIWNMDSEKYRKEQKSIEERIKLMQKRNGEILRKQIENNNKRKKKKNGMNITEFSLNKKEINKIIDSMDKEK